jgi:hypothetical protein
MTETASNAWFSRPDSRCMPSMKEQDEVRSRLLSKMDASFLQGGERVVLDCSGGGICSIGLLDPVSSIMANSAAAICCTSDPTTALAVAEMSWGGVPSTASSPSDHLLLPLPSSPSGRPCATCSLPTPTVRGMARFSLDSPVAKPAFLEALALSAQIAKRLAHVWVMLCYVSEPPSSRPESVAAPGPGPPCCGSCLLPFWILLLLGSSIIPATLQMVFLDVIHGFYLKISCRAMTSTLWRS